MAEPPDLIAAESREPRGSVRLIKALLENPIYVLGQVSRPGADGVLRSEPFDQRVFHRVDGKLVLTVFSSRGIADQFLRRCGVDTVERFAFGLGNDFVHNTFQVSGRVFLNPRSEYERELWPEEVLDLPRISG